MPAQVRDAAAAAAGCALPDASARTSCPDAVLRAAVAVLAARVPQAPGAQHLLQQLIFRWRARGRLLACSSGLPDAKRKPCVHTSAAPGCWHVRGPLAARLRPSKGCIDGMSWCRRVTRCWLCRTGGQGSRDERHLSPAQAQRLFGLEPENQYEEALLAAQLAARGLHAGLAAAHAVHGQCAAWAASALQASRLRVYPVTWLEARSGGCVHPCVRCTCRQCTQLSATAASPSRCIVCHVQASAFLVSLTG